MKNIFVISQNKYLAKEIGNSLQIEECSSYTVSVEEVCRYLELGKGDIIILDASFDRIDLEKSCTAMRALDEVAGIMVLAKCFDTQLIKSLFEIGIDYYIPIETPIEQVVARVERMCKRMGLVKVFKKPNLLVSGELVLDCEKRLLHKNGEIIKLTTIEYEMMKYFMMNQDVAISRDQIMDWIWGSTYVGDPKVVDVNVMRLRQKIESNPKSPKYVCTVWGYGYRWEGSKY